VCPVIGCLTIKQFPAWALSLVKRCDRKRPLLVQEDGHIVAMNRIAKDAGLEAGMTSARARSLCPSALLLLRDAVSEYSAWEYVVERLHRITPFLESDQPVAWLGVKPEEIREAVVRLRACAGFAPQRTTAQLAAIRAGTGETVCVSSGNTAAFLDSFPSRLLPEAGFAEEIVERLDLLGCAELGPLRRLTRRHLVLAFGREGEVLYEIMHPEDSKPVGIFHPAPVVRRHFELEAPCSQPGELLPIIAQLVGLAAPALGSQFSGQVRVVLHPENRPAFHGSRVLPHPTSRADTLERFAVRLGAEMLEDLNGDHRPAPGGEADDHKSIDIERVDLFLAGLMTANMIQSSLFGKKSRKVAGAIGEVHRRYPNAVKHGVVRPGAHFHEDRFGLKVWEAGRVRPKS
jgi:impB/mucB/samB family